MQDTTTVNFTSHQALGGQGPIGKSRNSGTTGFHAHRTLVLGADGYVFGMLESEFYTRDAQAHEAKRRESLNKRNREKAEEKESARWLRSLRHTAALATARDTQTITVNVADREADMYELWLLTEELRAATPQLHLLIRSQHNRKLHGSDNSLHDTLAAQSAQARWKIELPAAKGIASKTRQVECVWQQATLAVPAHQKKYQGHTQTLKLWAIEVREPSPPTGAEALHWIILSTWPITDELSARRALGWYVQRWQIEVLHRTWKTGCKVEERRVQQPRVMKCLMMLDLMVAAQLMSVVKAARLSPEAPADKLLTAAQSECLAAHNASTSPAPGRPEKNIVHEAGNPAKETAQPGMTIGKAVENIARLGGYRGNIQKRPPGGEVLWRGLQRLNDLTSGWLLAKGQKSG